MNTPKFNAKLEEWTKHNPLVAGEIRALTVEHNDWCWMLKRKGDCNCNPTFSYKKLPFMEGDFFTATLMKAPPAGNN